MFQISRTSVYLRVAYDPLHTKGLDSKANHGRRHYTPSSSPTRYRKGAINCHGESNGRSTSVGMRMTRSYDNMLGPC